MSATRVNKMRGGVYIYRTRKPGAIIGLPLYFTVALTVSLCASLYVLDTFWWWLGLFGFLANGRHFGYVGETRSFYHRGRQHLLGSERYDTRAQPWCDLDPKCYKIPLPGWKWLLLTIETLMILLVWPVYNDRKNRWNPRRISLGMAQVQRMARNDNSRLLQAALAVRPHHVLIVTTVAIYVWSQLA